MHFCTVGSRFLTAFHCGTDEKGGLFSGLKEKLASKYSKNDGKPTFAGAPPGSANPPEGWSFATNRGPTGGSYGPSPGSYNPEEPYRPAGYAGGGYRAGSSAYGSGGDPRESANSQLREKAYGKFYFGKLRTIASATS